MKKHLILSFILIFSATLLYAQNTRFEPDMSLLTAFENADKTYMNGHRQPYMAIFKKDGKTLIYLASRHQSQETLDMVDYIYKKFKPKAAVVEWEETGRRLADGKSTLSEAEYSITAAAGKNIPFILADLSDEDKVRILAQTAPDAYKLYQAKWMIQNSMNHMREFGTYTGAATEVESFKSYARRTNMPAPMDEEGFKNWFQEHFKADFDKTNLNEMFKGNWYGVSGEGIIFNKFSNDKAELAQRDRFMLTKIADALNKYKTIYAEFGEGHYRVQRKVLEKMLGEPKYIWEIPSEDENNRRIREVKQKIKEEVK